jgi:hypothetical protein
MIFQQSGMPSVMHDAVPFGVGMHTLSTFIGSIFFARLSGCKAIMGGPDLNPVVRKPDSNPRPFALLQLEFLCPSSLQSAEGRTFESHSGS